MKRDARDDARSEAAVRRRGALEARVVEAGTLDARERDAMFALMDRFYADVDRCRFDEDLDEKQWCVLLRSPQGAVRGFSTQTLLETPLDGRVVRTLFSGDTIVERDAWGSPALLAAVVRLGLFLIDRHPEDALFWFLTTQGFRTYRLLPLFYRTFHPCCSEPTPPETRRLIDAVAGHWFPTTYDAERGVIRPVESYRLRRGVADVSAERLRNRHVRYFHERNPGHARGDELCCIAPLTRENLSAAAWRVVRTAPVDAVKVDLEGHA